MTLTDTLILVTGANGHVGSNLVPALLAEGAKVRALVRENADISFIDKLPIEIIRGDISSKLDMLNATKGTDFVFHLASPTTIVKGLELLAELSTKALIESCIENKVRKIVYTSSAVTFGYSDSQQILLDETSNEFVATSPYHSSKYKFEKALLENSSLKTVIVNPTSIVGRFDKKVTSSTLPAFQARNRRHQMWFDSGVTIAPVRNIAYGHVLALKNGKPGQRYILGGQPLNLYDYFSLLNELNKNGPPQLKVPNLALYSAGAFFTMCQYFGFDRVPFDFKRIKNLIGKYAFYSSNKAKNELGYQIGTARDAVMDYYHWLDMEKY